MITKRQPLQKLPGSSKQVQGFLCKEEFKKLIPLHADDFYSVPEKLIDYVDDESNDLEYSKQQKGRTPKSDFRRLKPFKGIDHKNVHLFFIYHKDDQSTKEKLRNPTCKPALLIIEGFMIMLAFFFIQMKVKRFVFKTGITLFPKKKSNMPWLRK